MKIPSPILTVTLALSLLVLPSARAVLGGLMVDGLKSRNKDILLHNTVRFVLEKQGRAEHLCSGVIIGDGQVLSAAHCFNEEDVVKALARGEVSMRYFDPTSAGQYASLVIPSQSVQLSQSKKVDLAFIHLDQSFQYREDLPLAYEGCAVNSPYIVAGFGTTLDSSSPTDLEHLGLHSVKMKSAALGEGAITVLQETIDPRSGKSNGIGCFGDSGGPSFCKDLSGRWALEGINHVVFVRAKSTAAHRLSGRELCQSARYFWTTSVKWNMDMLHDWRVQSRAERD